MKLSMLLKLLVLSASLVSYSTSASDNTEFYVYLAKSHDGAMVSHPGDTPFDCSDVVYLMVYSSEPVTDEDQIGVVWTGPTGKDEVRAQRGFVKQGNGYWSWSGLQLNRAAGSNIASLLDTSNGMTPFIGDWTVDVSIQGRTIANLNFEMLC